MPRPKHPKPSKTFSPGTPRIIYTVGQLTPFLIVIGLACVAGYADRERVHRRSPITAAFILILFLLAAFAVICLRYFIRAAAFATRSPRSGSSWNGACFRRSRSRWSCSASTISSCASRLGNGCSARRHCIFFRRTRNSKIFQSTVSPIWNRLRIRCGIASFASVPGVD